MNTVERLAVGEEHCRSCGDAITDTRFALARAKTGDLVFCGGQCWRQWEADAVHRVQRLAIDEEFRQIAADCIQRRHPHAAWLAGKRPEDMNDATIIEAVRRLKAWLEEQPPLPIHPDSWIAKRNA